MNDGHLPSGRVFVRRVISLSYLFSVPALAIVLGCLLTLLELTGDQWRFFIIATAAYGTLISFPTMQWQARIMRPVREYLDARREGETSPEQRHAAFAMLIDLPRRVAIVASSGWVVPVVLLSVVMAVRFPQHWGAFEAGVLVLAGVAAGFVSASFMIFLVKRNTFRVRQVLTGEIPDSTERQPLIRPLRLRTKLLVCTAGVTLVPVIFSVMLSHANVRRSLEEFSVDWQQRTLQSVARELQGDDLAAARRAAIADDATLPASLRLVLFDGHGLPEDLGLAPLVRGDLAQSLAEGGLRGDGLGLPSDQLFSWLRLADGRVLMALTPKSELSAGAARMWVVIAVLLASAAVVALCLAWLLSSDVSSGTEALRSEAERVASGDLRRVVVCASEDELGDLSRAFEAMADSLRATVARVAEATENVEGAAGELASVATNVSGVTAEQVQGIQQATTSMESINEQVRGIANSSQALSVSVEESSSSILELGATGEELQQTATSLSGRVEEVSSSIEQMVRSVRQVFENTEGLSEASVETSASMEEMASSMREVDTVAEDTARLSREVVASAEAGQQKVSQTIEGMNAIREATETAERVIRGLGDRTTEIGAIVDVIDDVADETNLLALNAAIIAAQAGEHGRAFSVVADEIKDLADRVLASTKEIGGLIRSVQDEASNAIGAIEQGTVSVASGVDLSAEAGVSLEEITRASRESGSRIGGIVVAVREQAKAASHVVDLMEQVRSGVDEIRAAAAEQTRGNEVVHRGAVAMRDVAQQVRHTTEEQARGSGRIRENIEEVREAVDRINTALQEQSAACRSAVEFLEAVYNRTRSNEESAQRLDRATHTLLGQAETLREAVQRFRI
jgi:methyl-accepting chemotaxis protein